MIPLRFARLALAAALLFAAVLPAFAASNKWRIQCSESAKSSGELLFRFTPEGEAAVDVVVPIPDGTSENDVARRIRDVFRAKLDPQRVHVEVDDGEDVLVKKKGGQPDFDLALVSNTVQAVRIKLDRE